jgi:hypothetical protein
LEVEGETPAKIIQRHLKTIGFDLNHDKCTECDAYGKNASTNNYKCTKGYKCIDGVIGVKSASALIIFQSKCNPANPYAQNTGEQNIITGQADNTTINSLCKYAEIKSKEGKEKRGIVKLSREDMIKDWKPVKYETIANGELPKGLTGYMPGIEGKVRNLPSTLTAWAMLVQGMLEQNISKNTKLKVNMMQASSIISGYRDYKEQVSAYIRLGSGASTPSFKKGRTIADKFIRDNRKNILNNLDEYIKKGAELEGVGNSNHGIGRAIDFMAGSKKKVYLINDTDGTKELLWLNDNAGKYGFTGLVTAFKEDYYLKRNDIILAYNKKMGFLHFETWHWEYLVDHKIYAHNSKKYTRLDCFIKEKRDELLK